MSFSFSINSNSQSSRLKKPSASFSAAADHQEITFAADASPTRNYVREFKPDEAPRVNESKIKPIAPIPNEWCPIKKLKNLPNLPSLSQTNGSDSSLQFELDPGSNPEATDNSMGFGLNLRQPPAANGGLTAPERRETISELELRKLREDLKRLPEDTGMDEFTDLPVEGFGAALLSGYGWKEGQGIGRNAKEDVKVYHVTKKTRRGGLGFTGEFYDNWTESNGKASENLGNANVGKNERMAEKEKKGFDIGKEVRIVSGREMAMKGKVVEVGKVVDVRNLGNANVRNNERRAEKEKKGFDIGKEVRIVSGREMGMKGKVVEVRRGGDTLVLRLSRNEGKVKVRTEDVAELGSAEEDKCLKKLKELRIKEESVDRRKRDRNPPKKTDREQESTVTERVNWLRNHIRVRVISKELKGGRLFLKKGVVVDVVGPGMCDISMDESRELIQGVEQELLETALPKRGGPVLVLCGTYKGVYGSLLERDSENETGIVQDADTHEMLNVGLEQIAEYIGDPSHIGY